jgi:hypothetical protein
MSDDGHNRAPRGRLGKKAMSPVQSIDGDAVQAIVNLDNRTVKVEVRAAHDRFAAVRLDRGGSAVLIRSLLEAHRVAFGVEYEVRPRAAVGDAPEGNVDASMTKVGGGV